MINLKREGADVPVWTAELGGVCSHLHEVGALGFSCSAQDFQTSVIFWVFPTLSVFTL